MQERYEVRWTTFGAYGAPRNHVRQFGTEADAWDFRNAEVNKHGGDNSDPATRVRIVHVTEREVS